MDQAYLHIPILLNHTVALMLPNEQNHHRSSHLVKLYRVLAKRTCENQGKLLLGSSHLHTGRYEPTTGFGTLEEEYMIQLLRKKTSCFYNNNDRHECSLPMPMAESGILKQVYFFPKAVSPE